MWLFEEIAEGFTEANEAERLRFGLSRVRYIMEIIRRESLWAFMGVTGPSG
jgi:hypothetical protein